MVRESLKNIMSEKVAIVGVGDNIRTVLACFYVNNGLVACRNPNFLQRALDALMVLFDRVGLGTNTKKMECMTLLPGKIRTCLTEEEYRARTDTEFRKEREGQTANYNLCGLTMTMGSPSVSKEESTGYIFEARRDLDTGS